MEKKYQRLKDLFLMALRCEFVEGPILTKKGRRYLTAKQWRKINDIRGWIFPQWRKDMLYFLKSVQQNEKIRQLYS